MTCTHCGAPMTRTIENGYVCYKCTECSFSYRVPMKEGRKNVKRLS